MATAAMTPVRGDSSASLSSAASTATSSQFLNSDSIGRLTRTYLVVAAKLKMERHGRLAENITAFDRKAAAMDQDGKRLEAFVFKERALVLRQQLYGLSHLVVTEAAKELGLQYSIVAMDMVRSGDTVQSLQLLEKAEVLTSSSVLFPDPIQRKQLLAVMYNNFGCYYKFLTKYRTALKYLQKALQIESSVPGCQNPAGTHLNVCALLSQMGRHRSALHHAQLAIHLLQTEHQLARANAEANATPVLSPPITPKPRTPRLTVSTGPPGSLADQMAGESSTPKEAIHGTTEASGFDRAVAASAEGLQASPSAAQIGTGSTSSGSSDSQNTTCLMVIAIFNAAVELEHIGADPRESLEYYQQALKISKAELGPDHSLTKSVKATLSAARKSAKKAMKRKTQQSRELEIDAMSLGGSVSSSSSNLQSSYPKLPPGSARSRRRSSGGTTGTMTKGAAAASGRSLRPPGGGASRASTRGVFTPKPPSAGSTFDASWSATGGLSKSSARLPSAHGMSRASTSRMSSKR